VLVVSTLSIGAIFLSRRGFSEGDPLISTVGLSLLAVAFASLIAVALSTRGSGLDVALSATPLVILGQYSYGLYVFHQPVALLLRDAGWQVAMFPSMWGSHIGGLIAFGGLVCLFSGLLAFVSWHVWEAPFLRLKRYLPYRQNEVQKGAIEPESCAVAAVPFDSR
jgi:peptidoglycan/LPS O-acetylase OafA/YrhL